MQTRDIYSFLQAQLMPEALYSKSEIFANLKLIRTALYASISLAQPNRPHLP